MKKTFLIALLGTTSLFLLQPVHAIPVPGRIIAFSEPATTEPGPLNDQLTREFLALSPKKYYEMTGKKMSVPQMISLKLAQQKIKRMLRKGKVVDLLAMGR